MVPSLYTFVLSIVRKSVQEQVTVISLAPHSQRLQRQSHAFLSHKPKHLLVVYFCLQILKAFKGPSKRVLLLTLRDQSSTISLRQGIKVLFDLHGVHLAWDDAGEITKRYYVKKASEVIDINQFHDLTNLVRVMAINDIFLFADEIHETEISEHDLLVSYDVSSLFINVQGHCRNSL